MRLYNTGPILSCHSEKNTPIVAMNHFKKRNENKNKKEKRGDGRGGGER
jgi:hypothetical protein